VFVCTGSRCAPDTNQEIYKELKAELKELKVDQVTVRRSQASCFGICEGGPILVVYPEGTWYHHVTRGKLKTIINEHLLKGKIIKEWTIPVFPPPNATS
jgi:(2Fe-2S) ferredoxin